MDKMIFDNPVSSHLLFTVVLFSGIIISFSLFLFTKRLSGKIIKRVKSVIIIFAITLSIHIGSEFYELSTDPRHYTFMLAKMLYVASFASLFIKLSYFAIERIYMLTHTKENILLTNQVVGLLKKTSFVFISLIAFTMMLNIMGFNIFSVLTGLGIGGLAIALGAQELLSNIFGGITVFVSGIIKPGDFIEFDSHTGYVHEIGMRTTKVKRLDGKIIIVPNSHVVKSVIVNHTTPAGLIQTYILPLKYSMKAEEIKKASDLVREILTKDERITEKNSIGVGFYRFDTYSLNLYVSFVISDLSVAGMIKEDFHYMVKHIFDKEALEFAFPTQTVEVLNKNK